MNATATTSASARSSASASSVLRLSALRSPLSPLFVERGRRRPIGDGDGDGDRDGDACGSDTSLSYGYALEATLRHRLWIEETIRGGLAGLLRHSGGVERFGSGGGRGDAVAAYLSSDRPDLLLSVLGCLDAASAADVGTTDPVPILPVMLNARWTPIEIARALAVSGGPRRSTASAPPLPKIRFTLILYGLEHEIVARRAVDLIERDATQRDLGHRAEAVPLPSFAWDQRRGSGGRREAEGEAEGEDEDGDRDPISGGSADVGGGARMGDLNSGENPSLEDDAIVLFTSGTTSPSRGVRLSHRSLICQAMAKLCPPCSYDADTRMAATTVPFFHVGGISSALAVIMAGGTMIFPCPSGGSGEGGGAAGGRPGFRPNAILDLLSSSGRQFHAGSAAVDTLVVVPAMLHAIFDWIDSSSRRSGIGGGTCKRVVAEVKVRNRTITYDGVRLILVGGQSLSPRQLKKTVEVFPFARIVQTYACTEAGSSITFAPLVPAGALVGSGDGSGDFVGYAPPTRGGGRLPPE